MFECFRRKKCTQRCGRQEGEEGVCCAHPLSDFAEESQVVVVSNSDKKTLEMGLFSGAMVCVLKNRPSDANMVIAAGESRYIIAKDSAAQVLVH